MECSHDSDLVTLGSDGKCYCSQCGEYVRTLDVTVATTPFVVTYGSGVNRSAEDGKLRYDLMSMLMLRRWAAHMTKNVASKGDANWRLACTEEDIARAKRSVWRHFMDWYEDRDTGEDNAAAILFGIGLVEEAKEKMREHH